MAETKGQMAARLESATKTKERLTAMPRGVGERRGTSGSAGGDAGAAQSPVSSAVESASIDHTWGALARALELNDSQAEDLEAAGRRYLEAQSKIDRSLIESAAAILAGEDRASGIDRLDEVLRQRHALANGEVMSEFKELLDLIGQARFTVFKKQAENSLLQILADQDFAAWRRFLEVRADQEDGVYRILYESWGERMASPPPEPSASNGDLDLRLSGERAKLLAQLGAVLGESQLELLRVTLEQAHQRSLRGEP
jgi:hypothetical protein